ncbi:MAG: CvpA family protein [Lachnospiraceae bacterium]|nr:CvpA family protein [Lachnospiraceae bacterium]
MKFKTKAIMFIIFLTIIIGCCYYYVALPAINYHAPGFWSFVITLFVILSAIVGIYTVFKKGIKNDITVNKLVKGNYLLIACLGITIALVLIYAIGSFLSSSIINAKKYRNLINIEESDFTSDIEQISYTEIPLLDRASAEIVGARKMGTMVEYVSQFEVSSEYTQINYQGRPVRVTPLQYGNLLKWFTNKKEGIPAYIMIDMASQDAECIKLKEGIKYSKSEHFGRNIYRHIRFKYPTYMFDNINMEIDEEGTPYWICPVKDYTIGLFGGMTISNVVLVNAITGECTDYDINDVPQWVDHVFSAELLISYYDYYGTLQHGYLNSILSQKDCLMTTDGYNYIASDDDVWVYTGVTSVGGDESNVGFVLMNQRTGLTRYYQIPGAEEYSAMSSAEGKVQHLGYTSTFPILLNISNEPTYFMSLKDSAGLVKMYAMVNIQKYTVVATASTVLECEQLYKEMLVNNNITEPESDEPVYSDVKSITGTITKLVSAVINGNTHYYINLNSSEVVYDVNLSDNLEIVMAEPGKVVTFEYSDTEEIKTVISVK